LTGVYFFAIVEHMAERGYQRGYLGEFELMILLVLIALGDDAYGVPIARELERHRGREVALGSVYASLERLEGKGLVSSKLGEPIAERGGKARRYFQITQEGLRQANETRQVLTRMWRGMPKAEGEGA
jgi:PadR family transcriptional regulator, regulatory protein PadR